MAAAGEQAEKGRLERDRLEVERGHVPEQVVNRNQRQTPRPGDRFGGGDANEQRPDQARSLRDGDAVQLLEGQLRLFHCASHDRRDQLQVPARGDFRHNAAKAGVQLGLRRDDIRPQAAAGVDQRRRSLVAGGLDRQDHVPRAFTVRYLPTRARCFAT